MQRTWKNSKVSYKNRKPLKIVLRSRLGMHVDDLNTFIIDALHSLNTSKVISLHKVTEVFPAVTIYFWRETCTWKKPQSCNF